MTEKKLYTCDICHTDYNNKADAQKCEKEHCVSTVMKDFRYSAHSKYPHKVEITLTDRTTRRYKA